MFHRVSYVTGGAGFLPSTLLYADTYNMRVDIHVHLVYFCLG